MAEAKVATILDGSPASTELRKGDETSKDLDISENRSGSPEPNCAICLSRPKNKSFTDSCLHQFCFSCLLEWSKVKPECPLCKQTFRCIIHNIRSLDDYDKYLVNTTPSGSTEFLVEEFGQILTRQNERFRYRTTMVFPYRYMPAEDLQDLYQSVFRNDVDFTNLRYNVPLATENYVLPSTRRQSRRNLNVRYGTSDFRRNIYRHNLWARPMPDVTGRYRESSPAFYRLNEALCHRLVPWLNRELNALLRRPEQQNEVTELILRSITQYPIRSQEFINLMTPFFGERTRHFIHEFYSYAVSPFDLIGYDQQMNYVSYAELGLDPDAGLDLLSDSDSDIQIVEDVNRPPTERSSNNETSADLGTVENESDSDCIVLDEVVPERPNIELIEVLSDSDNDSTGDVECVQETKPNVSRIEISSDDDFFCIEEPPEVKETIPPPEKPEETLQAHELPSTSRVSTECQQNSLKRKTRGKKSLSYHLDMLEDISDSNEEWLPNGKKSRKAPKTKKWKKKDKMCCCARQKRNKHWKKELLSNASDISDISDHSSHWDSNSDSDPDFCSASSSHKAPTVSKHRKNPSKIESVNRKLSRFRFKYKKYCCEQETEEEMLSPVSDSPWSNRFSSSGDESNHHFRSKSKKSSSSADNESSSQYSKIKSKKSLGSTDILFNSKTSSSNSKSKSLYPSSRKFKKSKLKKSIKTYLSDSSCDSSSISVCENSGNVTSHRSNSLQSYSPPRCKESRKTLVSYSPTEDSEDEGNKFYVENSESNMLPVENSSSHVEANSSNGTRPRLKSVVRVVNSNWKSTNSIPHYEIVSSSLLDNFDPGPSTSASKSYDLSNSSASGSVSSSASSKSSSKKKINTK